MIEYIHTYFIGWSPRGFSESNFRVTDDVGETGSSYKITVIAFTCNPIKSSLYRDRVHRPFGLNASGLFYITSSCT